MVIKLYGSWLWSWLSLVVQAGLEPPPACSKGGACPAEGGGGGGEGGLREKKVKKPGASG